MALKKFRPLTPGQRFKLVVDSSDITAGKPEKSLVVSVNKRSGGRNNSGKMTMRYIGGGHKRAYRLVDFKRDKQDVGGVVQSVEYDPNRTARIALVYYNDGEKRYIIAPNGIQVGQKVMSGKTATPEVGNAMFMNDIPLGTIEWNEALDQPRRKVVVHKSRLNSGAPYDYFYSVKCFVFFNLCVIFTVCL